MDNPTYTLAEILGMGTVVYVDFGLRAVVVWDEGCQFHVFTDISEDGQLPNFEDNGSFFNNNASSGTAPGIAKQGLNA